MISLIIVDLPHPDGAEIMINFPFIIASLWCYITLRTCSLICSSSSFIFTTIICISAWFDLEPNVFISRPHFLADKAEFFFLVRARCREFR